jgi:hypothetical protein
MNVSGKRVSILLLSVIATAIVIVSTILPHSAYAAQITVRSLTLQAGSTDGGSLPSGVVNHRFDFTIPSTGNVGSIKFEYCTTASVTACVTPTGLSTTSATIADMTSSGAVFDSLNNSTQGAPYLTRASAASITGGTAVNYTIDGVTNPSTVGTFFVRISTYASSDTSGAALDTGTVAASTNNKIVLTGVMPESLIFCAGAAITVTDNIPDCTTATAGNINFNQLFSPTDTATATSQMAASTNAVAGYAITVNGTTLTSGSNTVAAMATSDTSKHGKGQFGMNLAVNTTPAIGSAITPSTNGTNFKGEAKPSSGYDVSDTFKYVSGDTIADSANGGAGPTDSQLFTSSYIVNVSGSQPAGTYTTTLTYICTPTF